MNRPNSSKFLESPSFGVNGVNLYPEERLRYNLSYRVYATPQGMKGAPTVDMFRQALQGLLKSNPNRTLPLLQKPARRLKS